MFVVPKGRIIITQDKSNNTAESDSVSQITPDDEGMETVCDTVEEQAAAIASVTSQGATLLDPNIQYQLRTENGQGVTYRLVQVTQNPDESGATAQVMTTAATLVGSSQVAQAIIASPFTSSANGSPEEDCQEEDTKFAYFPTTPDGTIAASPETAALASAATGQFYVMMTPQPGQRTLAPRTHQFSPKSDGTRTARDERRRATHNEVERRRRDKINNWIIKLSKVVPDCTTDHDKQGQVTLTSKGGILAKACDYIGELKSTNDRLPEILKENERLSMELEMLKQQQDETAAENLLLRSHMQRSGINLNELVLGGPAS